MLKRRTKILLVLLAVAAVLVVVGKFFLTPFIVVGDSMLPTLRTWDLCVMRRTSNYQPVRGDIVMFRTADDPPLHFVKRVLALPGETLAIEAGVVKINGTPLPEPYETLGTAFDMALTNVPPGRVFVIGDNREGTLSAMVATRLIQAQLVWHWRWKQ